LNEILISITLLKNITNNSVDIKIILFMAPPLSLLALLDPKAYRLQLPILFFLKTNFA